MSTEAEEGPPAERSVGRGVVRGATILLIVVAGGAGALLGTCAYRAVTHEGEAEEPETVTIVRPTADVIVAVRDLARLETAESHIERVVDLRDRQTRLFGLVDAEDAILLVAAGDVVAGVDLSRMEDGDVVVYPDAHAVTITLPPPEVLSTRLDNDRTYVHTRVTDTLARRSETLETRARQEAEGTLRDSAVEAGLLDRARANATTTVTTLVRALGYERIEIRFSDQAD